MFVLSQLSHQDRSLGRLKSTSWRNLGNRVEGGPGSHPVVECGASPAKIRPRFLQNVFPLGNCSFL